MVAHDSTDGHDALQLLFNEHLPFHSLGTYLLCTKHNAEDNGMTGRQKNQSPLSRGLQRKKLKYDCVKIPDDRYK